MNLKKITEEKIQDLTFSFWHSARFKFGGLPAIYEEIQQLKQDLEMIIGIEKAAFMYAMISVNGSTELISEAAFKVYLSKEL